MQGTSCYEIRVKISFFDFAYPVHLLTGQHEGSAAEMSNERVHKVFHAMYSSHAGSKFRQIRHALPYGADSMTPELFNRRLQGIPHGIKVSIIEKRPVHDAFLRKHLQGIAGDLASFNKYVVSSRHGGIKSQTPQKEFRWER